MCDSLGTIGRGELLALQEEKAIDMKDMNAEPVRGYGELQEGKDTTSDQLRLIRRMKDYISVLEHKDRARCLWERQLVEEMEQKQKHLEQRENEITKWEKEVRTKNQTEGDFNNRANELLGTYKKWEASLEQRSLALKTAETHFETYRSECQRRTWWWYRTLFAKARDESDREGKPDFSKVFLAHAAGNLSAGTGDTAVRGGQGRGEVGVESGGGEKRGIGIMMDDGETEVAVAMEGKRRRLSRSS